MKKKTTLLVFLKKEKIKGKNKATLIKENNGDNGRRL